MLAKQFLERFYTRYAPLEALDPGAPRHWKEKVLFYFMVLCVPGVLVLFACALPFIIENQYWLLLGTAASALSSAIMFVFFSRSLNYTLRSVTVSLLIYLFGLSVIISVGPFLASREWLFLFSIVAAVLLGWSGVVFSIFLNVLALVGIGIAIDQGIWQNLQTPVNLVDLWIQVAVDILFINLAATLIVTLLFSRLERSNQEARASAKLLETERAKLLELNQALEDQIEERKQLERQLSQAQKMQAIGTLAGGVAHDFNNLLSAIRGYSELATMIPQKDAELDNCLLQIQKACGRAEDLVKQILAFARQADQNRRPIKVRQIAEEVLILLRSTIPSSIHIDSRLESESMVMADPTQIHQIFLNLGSNAAQAMETEGGVLTLQIDDVVITAQQAREYVDLNPGDYVRIALSDMGVGIPEAHMDTIFEPYFTTKPIGGGTGLGLSVVHGIVKGLQGEIMVASQPGQGTCFTVYLPVTSESEPAAIEEDDTLPRGSGHILVVDDEEAVADMVGQTLKRFGYTVSIFTDSESALSFFGSRPSAIDAIVTDMTMPYMNGDVLAKKVKAIRPGVPVLLCTGYSSKLAGKAAAEVGVEALCLKPLTGKNLLTTLRAVLDQTRLQ